MKKFLLMLAATMSVLLTGCNQEANSIGVIGGADGPTAVFVTSRLNFPIMIPVIIVAVVIVGAIIWLITRHK